MDKQNLNEEKKKAILDLTNALGEQARTERGSPEEDDAKDHRAEAEEAIAKSRDAK